MSDITARIADPEDLRFLVMCAAVLIAGAMLAVAAASAPFLHRRDLGAGFRWVKRQ
ncbi:hypothetical protein [Bradyrhizobium sp. BR 10261]|uniref:hypothetical protein n=1 Tax=Bradyrhizobium sp. BR 10261 TaxID=2749992 RepID=UPI001C64A2F0|nr:hypothetical protein [Bradyrhizobium sp. BR 10261]MBW7966775.1 hypothetical protein [Bradyrhizobium sp. BR 10261]